MTLLGWILCGGLLIALAGGARRVRLWRQGRAARVNVWRGLAGVPKRYLVDVHDVVVRDRFTATMHVAAGGGVVAMLVLALLVHVVGVRHPLAVSMVGVAAVLAGIGAVLAFIRRAFGEKGASGQLSRGNWSRLPWSLLALAIGVAGLSLPGLANLADGGVVLAVLALLAAWGMLEVMGGALFDGPMKHAFAGVLHLAFHPRPERFEPCEPSGGTEGPDRPATVYRATALEPLDLDHDKLGVETPRDFTWNRRLSFDACVQCGRCEMVCPAFAAGQPLNPKQLIQDLVAGLDADRANPTYTGRRHPTHESSPKANSHADAHSGGETQCAGGPNHPIIGRLIDAATVWSCTTCRACVHECPMLIEHVDSIVSLRRFLTLERADLPGKAPNLLARLRETDNTHGRAPASRLDWATDLHLSRLAEGASVDVLLWVGDGAYDRRHQITLRALVKLMQAAGVDFAVLGDRECDVGDVARRLGDEATFQSLAARNIETLRDLQFNTIVTADPHVLHCLKNEYPAFGGNYRVLHHSSFLAELLTRGALVPRAQPGESITYHDPCYLGRYNRETQAPRVILQALGATMTEMQRSGLQARCCGGGGGAPFTDVPGKRRIPDMRMDDARQTGARTLAVACPNCMTMLEGVVQPRPEVRDIAELLWEAVAP